MRSLLVAVLSVLMITQQGCIKDTSCRPRTIASEESAMQAYAQSNNMNVTQHNSGLYYQIMNPGSGPTPTASSNVTVKYTGKLMDGTVFESRTTTPVTFPLGNTILGWMVGVPLIQKGGTIRLILPSGMAYGCTGSGSIPPHSILYFEIELIDVQ